MPGSGGQAALPALARAPFGRHGPKLLPVLVFLVLAGATVGGFSVSRQVSRDQEDKLLAERSTEAASYLVSTLGGVEAALEVLAAGLSADIPDAGAIFAATADVLVDDGPTTVGLLVRQDGGLVVGPVRGGSVQEGSPVAPDREAVARRAMGERVMAAGVFDEEGTSYLMVAVPTAQGVVFQDTPIEPTTPIPPAPGTPFSELRIALYASPRPDPEQLVLTTETQLPLEGRVHSAPFQLGTEAWSLSVAARSPLTGSLTRSAPWMVLGGGLAAAALAAAVVSVLARRHEYALDLVTTRTSDLARAQAAAERANRSKSEFLSRMSHELRTPLTAVLGFSQLLEMDELTDEQRESIRHIRKGGRHLLELINEVLDISRVEAGSIALSPEAVHVGSLVTDAIDLIAPLAKDRGIQVVPARSDEWDAHFLADRQRTQQILLNLLSNAVKYNRQRGTVAVSVSVVDESQVRVAVTDTGPGIRADQVDLAFLPFERLGAEHTDTEGSGIGLALSLKLAEAMGGTITVESTPGQGSTFALHLPAVEGPVDRYQRLHPNGAEEPARHGGAERSVLYIEDNLSNVTLVERVMATRPGVNLVTAMQGQLGVELAHEHRPALILLDLHLPDMSGEQVLQRLRDDPATASTPVVIVSADATPGQVRRLLSVGAADYLTKPIDIQRLLRIVDDALTRAGAHDD